MKILIFGFGKNYETAKQYNLFEKDEILAFIDNNHEKQKKLFENKPVISPNQIEDFGFDQIVIASLAYDEIYNQLLSLGVDKYKIFHHLEGRLIASIVLETHAKQVVPDGHFYSTIPTKEDINLGLKNAASTKKIEGIDFNISKQLELAEKFLHLQKEIPFPEEKNEKYRYYFNNNFYTKGCAKTLFSMMRTFKPKNIIEIGSGFSSALMLDTNAKYFDNQINCTFIEPYPEERLNLLLQEKDYHTTQIYKNKIQEVDLSIFETLKENDILFIDSSHVCKVGSDLQKILFEILPRLNKGVLIHFHDIMHPFEYPKQWYKEGRYWNEAYLLRAFLQYNENFKIILWGDYLYNNHYKELEKIDSFLKDTPGGNIWIQKTK
jgi:predicted O-methyltransferase YrrM